MNKLLLSIGSNENPESNMSLCRELLNNIFEDISFSDLSTTSPYGDVYKSDFLNQLAYAHTNLEKENIEQQLKQIEKQMGRLPTDKAKGEVKIDIDLIKWNDQVMKKNEWERDYIRQLLPSLEELVLHSSQNGK